MVGGFFYQKFLSFVQYIIENLLQYIKQHAISNSDS
jgi:hypothetical protein